MITRTHWLVSLTLVSACTVTATPGPSRPYEPPPPPPRVVEREHRPPPPPEPAPPPPPPPRYEPPPPAPPPREDNVDWAARGWVKLGEHTVDGRGVDWDQFDYSQKKGPISRVMIVALDSDIELVECKLVGVMGTVFTPEVRHVFREGQRSRPIDLPKTEVLRAVQLRYKNLPGGGRARVQVWAK